MKPSEGGHISQDHLLKDKTNGEVNVWFCKKHVYRSYVAVRGCYSMPSVLARHNKPLLT